LTLHCFSSSLPLIIIPSNVHFLQQHFLSQHSACEGGHRQDKHRSARQVSSRHSPFAQSVKECARGNQLVTRPSTPFPPSQPSFRSPPRSISPMSSRYSFPMTLWCLDGLIRGFTS
jgi:hypothetical protein